MTATITAPAQTSTMVWIPEGTFWMGSNFFYPEEKPVHQKTVQGFWMDRSPVTNQEFSEFVAATGYVTLAERPRLPANYPGASTVHLEPGGSVFMQPTDPIEPDSADTSWSYVPGAQWRCPRGPGSTISYRPTHPVVQIAFEDAQAYATWAGKELPTEAEWEYAARGGIDQAVFPWGNADFPDGRAHANTWQGCFPLRNLLHDGFEETSPVGSFPPNGFDLFDMTGNVWEWTADWYRRRHCADHASTGFSRDLPGGGIPEESFDPHQPWQKFPCKVIKGGSYLCSPNHNFRYRPAARQPESIDTATCDLGFRCVIRSRDDHHFVIAMGTGIHSD